MDGNAPWRALRGVRRGRALGRGREEVLSAAASPRRVCCRRVAFPQALLPRRVAAGALIVERLARGEWQYAAPATEEADRAESRAKVHGPGRGRCDRRALCPADVICRCGPDLGVSRPGP